MNYLVSAHPLRRLGGLLVAAICFFVLSASGQDGGKFMSDGPAWLGDIGWWAFVVLALLFVATAVACSVSALRERSVR